MPKKKKSKVNEAGNYTKPAMRKRLFNRIKAGSKGGKAGQWSARKAQMLVKEYAATTRKKREDTKKGKQHSRQPKKIAKKTSKHRRG